MDSSSFDRLARSVAGAASRRAVLPGLVALVGRLLLPGSGATQSRTTCREFGKTCSPERNLDCCPGTTCKNGRCRCPEGRRRCQGECRSVRRCCGNECGGGAICRDGRCVCPVGTKRCQGRCIRKNTCCGGCPAGRVCRGGRCVRTGCGAGQKPCNGGCIAEGACCTDAECGANRVCRNGSCPCGPGFQPCEGQCIAEAACCPECSPNQDCRAGSCCYATSAALQAAREAEGPAVIRLCPNTTYERTFSISRDVTIIGAGATSSILSGGGSGRVEVAEGVTVELQGRGSPGATAARTVAAS